MASAKPVIHGRDHAPGGADPSGNGSIIVTDGSTTVDPTTELDISAGLVLAGSGSIATLSALGLEYAIVQGRVDVDSPGAFDVASLGRAGETLSLWQADWTLLVKTVGDGWSLDSPRFLFGHPGWYFVALASQWKNGTDPAPALTSTGRAYLWPSSERTTDAGVTWTPTNVLPVISTLVSVGIPSVASIDYPIATDQDVNPIPGYGLTAVASYGARGVSRSAQWLTHFESSSDDCGFSAVHANEASLQDSTSDVYLGALVVRLSRDV